MRGLPITRVSSADGAWAYTLYDGLGAEPFVHALDTVGRKAVCIDLTGFSGRADLYDFRLTLSGDGKTLAVNDSRGVVSVIDTQTFEVSVPGAAPPPAAPRPQPAPPSRQRPVLVSARVLPIGAAMAALAVVTILLAFTLRRRRRVAQVAPSAAARLETGDGDRAGVPQAACGRCHEPSSLDLLRRAARRLVRRARRGWTT